MTKMNELNLKKILNLLEDKYIDDLRKECKNLPILKLIDLYQRSRNGILKDLCNNKD